MSLYFQHSNTLQLLQLIPLPIQCTHLFLTHMTHMTFSGNIGPVLEAMDYRLDSIVLLAVQQSEVKTSWSRNLDFWIHWFSWNPTGIQDLTETPWRLFIHKLATSTGEALHFSHPCYTLSTPIHVPTPLDASCAIHGKIVRKREWKALM